MFLVGSEVRLPIFRWESHICPFVRMGDGVGPNRGTVNDLEGLCIQDFEGEGITNVVSNTYPITSTFLTVRKAVVKGALENLLIEVKK